MNLSGSLFNMKRMNFMDALRHAITDPNNYTRTMTFKNEFRLVFFEIHKLKYQLVRTLTRVKKSMRSNTSAITFLEWIFTLRHIKSCLRNQIFIVSFIDPKEIHNLCDYKL